ncbi:MAG: TIM barrel protein [Planctomycetota bacterium]
MKVLSAQASAAWRFAALALCLLLASSFAPQPAPAPVPNVELMVYDFDLGPEPVSNVERMRLLGFTGLVTRCSVPSDLPKLAAYVRHVQSLTGFRMLAYTEYDYAIPATFGTWQAELPLLALADAPLWVIVRNAPSVPVLDALLWNMANTASAYGVPVVIYPHWDTDIESADEAAARIAQIGHPNLHLSLHTCHEIRSGHQYSLPAEVVQHVAATQLVTIAGAEDNAYSGPPPVPWDDAIRALDRSDFDLLPFLRALDQNGYQGPIILHTWGLAWDRGHHARSISRYESLRKQL